VGAKKMNPQLRQQLAKAFGLVDGAELDALISALRSGAYVDPQTLRTGCLALVESVGTAEAASAARCTADHPVSTPTDTAQSSRLRALPEARSRGRALVVEDNAVNQEMARAMLDMLGFEVFTASNGREGITAVAACPGLDLILMDCQMPVMDGLAAARAIRAAEAQGARVAIIALTGNAMPGDREACIAAGMDDYLAKPFSLSALRAMLDKWTGPATLAAVTGTRSI
jgi:two-component system, sensor histidine kinase and response regulator